MSSVTHAKLSCLAGGIFDCMTSFFLSHLKKHKIIYSKVMVNSYEPTSFMGTVLCMTTQSMIFI